MGDPKPIDPQTECLLYLRHAAIHLRDARAIAETLPNHGNLYAELKDASGIVNQAIASLQGQLARKVEVTQVIEKAAP